MYHHNADEEAIYFTRAHYLRPELASLCGLEPEHRHCGNQITQAVIMYVCARNLQNKSNHRIVNCDYLLQHVLGVPSFHSKELQSLLKPLIY